MVVKDRLDTMVPKMADQCLSILQAREDEVEHMECLIAMVRDDWEGNLTPGRVSRPIGETVNRSVDRSAGRY